MYLPWKWSVSSNPTGKWHPGVDKVAKNMDDFMNYVKNIAYPQGKALCHISNKYFWSRFDQKD